MIFETLNSVFALQTSADTFAPFSAEAWAQAGQMTLLGMLMVFAVLCALWAVLGVFKLVFAPKQKPKKKPIVTGVERTEKETAPIVAPAYERQDDKELVAVLTAAVAAYMAAEQGADVVDTDSFRVVSFKRVSSGRAWNSK